MPPSHLGSTPSTKRPPIKGSALTENITAKNALKYDSYQRHPVPCATKRGIGNRIVPALKGAEIKPGRAISE
jgi:hypothetical protein